MTAQSPSSSGRHRTAKGTSLINLINVAQGGTLYQDIAAQFPGALNHRNWEIYDRNSHATTIVRLMRGSMSGAAVSRLLASSSAKALGGSIVKPWPPSTRLF